uniref:Uncharacterized protein n=1 Tax=viral metagenome TaxID=1070528 RepID=A0A6C0KR81_9ZZZZ
MYSNIEELHLESFNNSKLKKLINAYTINTTQGNTPGLGDYLRGCLCFSQVAELLNLEFDMDISSHPISKFIKDSNGNDGLDYNNIDRYIDLNYNENHYLLTFHYNYGKSDLNINHNFWENLINWLNSKDCETFMFHSNAFPSYFIYKQNHIDFINSKIEPNDLMKKCIEVTLQNLRLTKKNYNVIHIRGGDNYLVRKKHPNKKFLEMLRDKIEQQMIPNYPYLLIADSNYLKFYLKKMIPNTFICKNEIGHLGGEFNHHTNNEKVKNSLLDYYLMSFGNSIISFTTNGHISGFSKICGILNNIPFESFKIDDI